MSAAVHQIAEYTPRSPQLENGFYQLSTELDEAILAADLTGNEALVLRTVIRKTYGFHQKQDDIAASQLGMLCRMASRHVTTILNSLAKKQFIHKRAGKFGCVIGVQKDYSRWPMRQMPEEYRDGGKKRRGRPSAHDDNAAPVEEIKTPPNIGVVLTISEEKPLQDSEKPLQELVLTPPNLGDTKDTPTKDKGQKNKTSPASPSAMLARFDTFWAAYPKKDEKKDAKVLFLKIAPDDAKLQLMLEAIDRAKTSGKWDEKRFIMNPAKWLRGERWNDEVQSAYSADEMEVLTHFNAILGPECGEVDEKFFVQANADLIRAFLKFDDRPELAKRYFAFIVETSTIPPMTGFAYVLSREGFNKFKGGQFAKRSGK